MNAILLARGKHYSPKIALFLQNAIYHLQVDWISYLNGAEGSRVHNIGGGRGSDSSEIACGFAEGSLDWGRLSKHAGHLLQFKGSFLKLFHSGGSGNGCWFDLMKNDSESGFYISKLTVIFWVNGVSVLLTCRLQYLWSVSSAWCLLISWSTVSPAATAHCWEWSLHFWGSKVTILCF